MVNARTGQEEATLAPLTLEYWYGVWQQTLRQHGTVLYNVQWQYGARTKTFNFWPVHGGRS